MKKLLTLAAMAALCLVAFTGCFSPSPTEVTTTFLEGVKANDTEAIAATYAEGEFVIFEVGTEDESDAGFDALLTDELLPKLLEFDYEIVNEAITEDTAAVDVKMTTYSLGSAFNNAISDYFTQGITMALAGASEEELSALMTNLFSDQIMNMEKTYTDTVTINLTKVDGAWVIDEFTKGGDFYDALTGGLVTSFNAYDDM